MSVFWANRKSRIGVLLLAFVSLLCAMGLVMGDVSADGGGPSLAPPSAAHWLGTTLQGQDVWAQTLVGAIPTVGYALLIGLGVTLLSVGVGVSAGFFGGSIDAALSLLINVFLLIPGLPLMIVLASLLPAGPASIAGVLIVTGWPWGARVLRSQALSLRSRPFVEAAKLTGDSPLVVIAFHLVPNMASLIGTTFIGATTYAVGAQVGLEFLGLGDPAKVTWGTNLYWATNDQALLTGAWWTFVPTGACIALFTVGLVMMSFALDEITNPDLAARRHFQRHIGRPAELDTAVRERS